MKEYFIEWNKRRPKPRLLLRFVFVSLLDAAKPVKKIREPEPINIDPSEVQVWMIGHSTVLINLYGTTILTDPVFAKWIPFPRRKVAAGFRIDELPELDIIAVSHAHWDHFNIRSLKKLAHKTKTLIIPKNCFDLVKKIPFKNVVEVGWNEIVEVEGITLHSYKPQHWGTRLPWEKMERSYNSYVLERKSANVFFCGDSAYCDRFFKEVGERHDLDIALLPIGAYNPPSYQKVHMNPEDAVQAFYDLGAKHMIPIHWGSFRLSREPMKEPTERLSELVFESKLKSVSIVPNGGGWRMRE